MNILKFIDKYIIGLATLYRPILKSGPEGKIRNILVVKLWALGDSVNCLPFIKALKHAYPHANITVLASDMNAQLFRNQPFIDEIRIFESMDIVKFHKHYDIGFDLEPYLNISALLTRYSSRYCVGFDHGIRAGYYDKKVRFHKDRHIVETYLQILSALDKPYQIPERLIALPDKRYASIDKYKMLVGICPSVGFTVREREWGEDNFITLARKILQDKNNVIVLIGSNKDIPICDHIQKNISKGRVINLAGKLDVAELCYVIRKCSIFISNDTGPMHIAAAQGVKTIGLFGANTPTIWAPYGDNISIYHPKKGCPFFDNTHHRNRPMFLTREQKTCMDAITVKEVYAAYKKLGKRR